MLTTSRFSLKKPQTADASNALRTAIGDNADIIDALLDARGYAQVLTQENTTSATVVDLATAGPSVSLTVPTNGLVAVRSVVSYGATVANMVVHLYEDAVDLGTILTVTSTDVQGKHTVPGSTTGATSAVLGGWVVFPAAAGAHVYKLRYASAVGGQAAEVKDRKLWARVLTF